MQVMFALAIVLLVSTHSLLADEPGAIQRQEWLEIQRAAIADPNDPAKLNAFLNLLVQVGDDYVVEGDILMSEDEVLRYLRNKQATEGLADPGGELIVEVRNGQRVYWQPGERVLTYAVRRESFPSEASYQQVVATMQAAADIWEKACAACQLDFQHLVEHDAAPSLQKVRFIVEHRLPTSLNEIAVSAFAFFPRDPPAKHYVVVLPAFFSSNISQTAILLHELGHVLGYRHEHILSPDAGCAINKSKELGEDATFEPLSELDVRSIMHYPCGSKRDFPPSLSPTDIEQHSNLYGVEP